jgi:elongation factor Ts
METKAVTFSAKDVMVLRQKTGLGMMDCKKALGETGGDLAAAEEWLREHLKGKMEKRTERTTAEGRVAVKIDGDKAVIVEVQTETDFTAKNEAFTAMMDQVVNEAISQPAGTITPSDSMAKAIDNIRITTGENTNFARGEKLEGGHFGCYEHHDGKQATLLQIDGSADEALLKGICQHIQFHDPQGIDENDVPAATLSTIRAEALAEAKESGKNDEIAQKIADGKVRKFLEEHTLMSQKYVLDDSKQVKDMLPGGVTIKAFRRYIIGGGDAAE